MPAVAAESRAWGDFEPLAGGAGAYTTQMTLAGHPALTADVTTDSRGGQVGPQTGASTWLSADTPVGAKYGSSRDQPYLNLRPKADTAAAPSTTTYTFASPTPSSGWAFVLGDIDADAVRISGVTAAGAAATASDLGFQGGFNYCAPSVDGKPSCTGAEDDIPTWDPATLTLTGNADAADTSGSSAWFEPTVPLASLTIQFTRRAGFPVYQTWFASISRDISGTVADQSTGPLGGVDLTLTDAEGNVVGTTTTADDGTYSFPGFIATDGYVVSVTPPSGKIADVSRQPVDLTTTDAAGVDFTVRDIVPVAVSGRVEAPDGSPVSGVVVTIPIDGGDLTAVTGPDGIYRFDRVEPGTWPIVVTPPDGYTVTTLPGPVTVPENSEEPIEATTAVVTPEPVVSISGTVTAAGTGVAGITVTAEGPGGVLTTVTGADGSYTFPGVDPGGYTVGIVVPVGTSPVGPASRPVTVGDDDVTDVDFAVARQGAVSGTVADAEGTGVAGASLTVDGPIGPVAVATEPDGTYGVGALPPGEYTITLTVPDGFRAVGPTTRTVTISDAGEVVDGLDFVIEVVPVTPPPTTPPASPSPTPPAAGGGEHGDLATTGGPDATPYVIAASLLLLAGAGLLIARRRRADRGRH